MFIYSSVWIPPAIVNPAWQNGSPRSFTIHAIVNLDPVYHLRSIGLLGAIQAIIARCYPGKRLILPLNTAGFVEFCWVVRRPLAVMIGLIATRRFIDKGFGPGLTGRLILYLYFVLCCVHRSRLAGAGRNLWFQGLIGERRGESMGQNIAVWYFRKTFSRHLIDQ